MTLSSCDLEDRRDQTVYPDLCNRYLIRPSSANRSISHAEFRKMVVELAMDQTISAQTHNIRLVPKCHHGKELSAWADCLTLYDDAVFHLNKILANTNPTDINAQTWLSTALTDLDTCRNGFSELGLSNSSLLPVNHDEISKMLSDSLAMFNNQSHNSVYCDDLDILCVDHDGFPSWLTAGDRRLLQAGAEPPADLVVAKDGSGNYRTVNEAVAAAGEMQRSGRFVIKIKSGVYVENVEIGNRLKNITLIGDGMKSTVITGNRSVGGGSSTFNSSTVAVTGEGFIAREITFRNTAGPQNGQAVALRSGSDRSAFYRCSFEGYQDTLYVHSNRQFYRECSVSGTVDFIFGNAAAVLQNCSIYARRPMSGQGIMVTAQGRTDPNQNTGISIHNSRVEAGPDLQPVIGSFRTYLGRPWKEYSRTVVMQTNLGSLVHSDGWSAWDGDFALKTLYYGEYRNTGPGAPTQNRVKWARVLTRDEAVRFTVGNFIAGQAWIPGTGIPFTAGL
ncbi:Probable pectinesterase/pectinesterase inhibitor 17 [Linum grandiflorum]